ncbi:MAG: KH domain-containing protein [Candidatus Shapirobacteria bacterium]|jgi:hypothetical protein
MAKITETLEYIVKAITPADSAITIEERDENGLLILEIVAPTELIGQIIGKEGKIIKSIRTILNLTYPNTKFTLDIRG